MKIYKVGGYVRDKILQIPSKDCDFVVVGSTPEEMLSQGFIQVGANFPVFLHPKTQDEYALARKEIKTGSGYTGFAFDFNPKITLEEDLYRRDLTINSMAMDEDGNIIDPYNGKQDLNRGILRHVSKHFAEDPVRVLRVARFSARYNFTVAPETMELMKDIVKKEFSSLTKERVFLEVDKALSEKHVSNFLSVLISCSGLPKLFDFDNGTSINFIKDKALYKDNMQNDPILYKEKNYCLFFKNTNTSKLTSYAVPRSTVRLIHLFQQYVDVTNYSNMTEREKFLFIKNHKSQHSLSEAFKTILITNFYNDRRDKNDADISSLMKDINLLSEVNVKEIISNVSDKSQIRSAIEKAEMEALQPKQRTKKPSF